MSAAAHTRTRVALVVLAAGDGTRSGHHTNKVLMPLAGQPVFTWSLRWARLPVVRRTVLVVREQDRGQVRQAMGGADGDVEVVLGGTSRHGSEWEALQVLAPTIERGEIDVVVIHDAARPLASAELFADVVDAAARHGCALPATEQGQLVALDPDQTLPDRVVAVQTPQAFAAGSLLEAYRRAHAEGFTGTDTASCVEHYTDEQVHWVEGGDGNIKITFADDLAVAERLLAGAGGDPTR